MDGMRRWLQLVFLLLIMMMAAVLRWTGIDWDGYQHYHPDERYINWVATTIEWPTDWSTAWQPTESTFNPFYWPADAESEGVAVLQDETRKFAYGHLFLYLGVGATRLTEWLGPRLIPILPADWLLTRHILNRDELIEFFHLAAVGRALTGLVDLGTIGMLYILGRRLYGIGVGLLAAAFLAFNVMHIQLAHFFTADPYLTFFVVTAVTCMVFSFDDEMGWHKRPFWVAALFVGLAVGSKFAAILLFLPLALTAWLGRARHWQWYLVIAGVISALAFTVTNPFAVIDLHCEVVTPAMQFGPVHIPAFDWKSCYLDNIASQSAMVRGQTNIAFTWQYTETLPYLYFVEMQVKWGMGPLLGIVAFVGLFWVTGQTAQAAWLRWREREGNVAPSMPKPLMFASILLAWCWPFFLSTGNFDVKFMRYLQPLVPFLMLFGAAMLWQWATVSPKWLGRMAIVLTLATTAVYAVAFVNMYHQPHPWLAASQWIYRNVEPGAVILSEEWDDSLPSTMTLDGERRRRGEYVDIPLTWHTGVGKRDSVEKLTANLTLLAEAEYVTILSNRIYGVAPRIPQRLPLSSQYHQLLFNGRLGYEPVYIVDRAPHLGGVRLVPDTFGWPDLIPPSEVAAYLDGQPSLSWGRADESFTVYDQPLTIIFKKMEQKTAAELLQLFDIE